jgi:ABC-type nitrate/sulfonate/bicarbonate transport system, ATPase component
VIQELSFSVRSGEFLTIIGPSGAGKSTLLNMIAQIDTVSAGEIVFNGETVTSHDARTLRPGFDRRIGYVTQDDNLLPWRTTIDNVLFPIEVQGRLNAETRAHAEVLFRAVGLAASSAIIRTNCPAACASARRSSAPSPTIHRSS